MERFEYIIVSKNLLLFKQWSRKKFAILCSLGKIIRIGVLCVSYSLVNHLPIAVAQPDSITKQVITQIQQVEVTGFRNQDAFSQTSRIITVIQKEDIEKAGIQNLQDLLEYTSNIDIRQRGLLGVQSDMSIRGGSLIRLLFSLMASI